MTRFFPFAALLLLAASSNHVASAQATSATAAPTWRVDATHSFIGFKVRHLGLSSVTGAFRDYDATITLDPADPASFRAEAVIQAASVDTENERRDNHLRSDDFFDAENHPELRFVTKEVRDRGDGQLEIVGDLTIRGTTQEIVLDGEIIGTAAMGNSERVGIEAEGRINRFDYGLKFDSVMEAGGFVVGEDVRLVLEIEAIKN
ncbi:MAG: polyisoprenoid-binding protein [Bacteroidetes bacterium CG12_big_fil_rev_8_21_14_0_65_60_17]|nr:MAG: polyisoprenoid-binding protein [Bacteroidetes bacterium CG12_big_fil_rev_8_21_14_0_65_60_17]